MQVHPSSRGWSVWPEWLSLLDSAVLSFPSTPAHANVFDLMATSFSRVQMQPTKLPVLNSLCKIWCFFPLGWAWMCAQELLAVASCAIPWDSLWALWSQGRISAQKGFVLPTALSISIWWHSEQGRTCPGLYRRQTISSIGNSHFSWHQVHRGVVVLWKTPGSEEIMP